MTGVERIAEQFAQRRPQGPPLFIPYLTVGDPSVAVTPHLITALVKGGANLIELGIPFSDPVADGQTNQQSAARALQNGFSIDDLFSVVKQTREAGIRTPLIAFSYFNPIFKYGVTHFIEQSIAIGLDGILIVDLPPEESGDISAQLTAHGLGQIFLAAPNTNDQRLTYLSNLSKPFLYCVARFGVTGPAPLLLTEVQARLQHIRSICKSPIAVGFGLTEAIQLRAVAPYCDGIVVGSALIKIIEENRHLSVDDLAGLVRAFAQKISLTIRGENIC